MIEDEVSVDPKTNSTPKAAGRPNDTTTTEANYSRSNIQTTIYEVEALISQAKGQMKEKLDSEELDKQQSDMVTKLCESIVCASDKKNWGQTLSACIQDFNAIEDLNTLDSILSVSTKHNLDVYASAILYHSNEN